MLRIAHELLRIAQILCAAETLDKGRIQKFRKDFLTLMKNAKIVSNYEQAVEWAKGMQRWRKHFEDYTFRYVLDSLKKLQYKKVITKDQYTIWDDHLRTPLWDLVINLSVPIDYTNQHISKDMAFQRFENELPSWERSVRRYSRKAWKALDEFVEWHQSLDEGEFEVNTPTTEQFNIEGFPVILMSRPDSYVKPKEAMAKLKKALSIVKAGASKYAPILLRMKIPIVVDLLNLSLDTGGEYQQGKVFLYGGPMTRNPKEIASVIAHELAHAVYAKHISGKGSDLWHKHISGNFGTLDLRDVLKKYGNEQDFFDNAKIKKKDPVLYLQLMGLINDPAYKNTFQNILSMDNLREYLEGGGEPKVSVNKKPVSGYGQKNSMEAFTEAMSLLTTYGPRALHPETMYVLKMIL